MEKADKFKKEYEKRMRHVWLVSGIQATFALIIIIISIVNAFSSLFNDAQKTSVTAKNQITAIVDGYESCFHSILIPIKDKIAENPSFDEMQTWLQSKEKEFKVAVGEDAYDGIALTYKGGYAHSWNYGDYSKYDPETRPWYQEAQKANGKVAIVAPYVTFLSADNQEVETTSVLMTIAQKYSDSISFDLDLKLPKIQSVLKDVKTVYPSEKIFIYNKEGQILSSTEESAFAHNVYKKDKVITKGLVKAVKVNAKNQDVLQVDTIDGKLQFLHFTKDSSGNTVAIVVPASEIFIHDFLIVFLVTLALIAFIIFVFVKSKRNAIEFVERDRRLEVIEDEVQKERLYIDTDQNIFFGNGMAKKNTEDGTYDSLYKLLQSRIVNEEELPKLEAFLAPDVIKKCAETPYQIDKERFFMTMQGQDGKMQQKTIEVRRLSFIQDKKHMAEIAMIDAEESVDLLRDALRETELVKQEKEDEYNRFMSYICMAQDGVEELSIKDHTITRFFIKDGKLEKKTISYPGMPFELWHEDDRPRAHELYDEDKLWNLCQKQEASYAELRMKWYDANEYHWCSVIVLGMPITEKTPFNVLVLIKDKNEVKMQEIRQKKALEDAFELAKQGSEAKGSFLSKMSHEIRTPLNAIIGYLGIAKDSGDNLEKIKYCIDNSEIASKHLLQIINDVLDMSSIENGKMKIANEEFDLKKEISDITTIFYQNAKNKKLRFETHIDNVTEEWVLGDQLRVNQVLMNLLSNAVKFTPEGGLIQLRVEQLRKDDEKVYMKLYISDTGIGMSNEYMSRIFRPFEQEQVTTARKYGGSGLGLSITNNLVQMMGGKIDVQSKQGEGTTFSVTMYFGLAKGEHESMIHEEYSHVRVLVVDDMKDDCSYIKMMLKRCGAKADTVTSGAKALKRIRSRKDSDYAYDLCIIDWNMPEMNGCEVTKIIRAELGNSMPIIIATAYDVSELQEEAKAAGADKVVSKPLFQSTLFDILVTHFGNYQPKESKNKEQVDMSGVRIILAEDNPMNMDIAVTVLEKAGITVDQAVNGREACDKFLASKKGTYSLILMDVQMPVMDGYEATEFIRKSNHPEAKTIPIVAMTANAFAEDVTEALAKGMNAHIAKPVDNDKLFAVLQRFSGK